MANYKEEPNSAKDKFQLVLNDWIYVAQGMLHSDNINYQEQIVINGMIRTIDVQLWSAWKKEFKFPVTLWNAIKIKFFPYWLLKKFPAQVKTFSVAEVIPSLSKNPETFKKQLEKNTIGEFESIVRQPLVGYEYWPPVWEN